MSHPLVSVIIPNYNHARFLRQRIESVLQQDFDDYELILLDDASTDESREVLEAYARHPRVSHVEHNAANSGSPFAQWQKGIALARGKYVWIAESDDYAAKDFLSATVALMESHPDASFCFAGCVRVDAEGRSLRSDYDRWGRKQLRRKDGFGVFDGREYIVRNLYWRSYVYNASGVLFRANLARQVDMTPCLSMRCSGDWLFWTEMAMRGQVIELYRKLNRSRAHSMSTSMQARKAGRSIAEDMEVVAHIEGLLPHIGPYKRSVRRGAFYKKIVRLKADASTKFALCGKLSSLLGGSRTDYYLERVSKCLGFVFPFLPSERGDRL